DVLAGKFVASSATAFLGLFALMPMLALPLLLGGVTAERFVCLAIELTTTLLLSVSWGFLASSLLRQGWAAMPLGLIAIGALGLYPLLEIFFDEIEPLRFASPSSALAVLWEQNIDEHRVFWQSVLFGLALAIANFSIV